MIHLSKQTNATTPNEGAKRGQWLLPRYSNGNIVEAFYKVSIFFDALPNFDTSCRKRRKKLVLV